jgi:(p)ppGpp synthase/HD superfamily hydrolase
VDRARLGEALLYALEAHAGQVRKGTRTPYVGHVLGVCALVVEDGGDEDEAIAALLHDAGEDAGGRERVEDVRLRFGSRVADIVEACSDTLETPKPPWRARKEAYVAAAEHHTPEALRVSLADKLYNVRTIVTDYRTIGEALWERFAGTREDVLWYYRSLADVFRRRLPESPLVVELELALAELERLIAASASDP